MSIDLSHVDPLLKILGHKYFAEFLEERNEICNMKRIFLVVTILLSVSIPLCSCYDKYAGKRPFEYPNTRWESQDPYVWFEISEDGTVGNGPYSGQVQLQDGTIREVQVRFNYTNEIFFHVYDENTKKMLYYHGGTSEFGNPEFTVILEDGTLFSKEYETITFVRTEAPDSVNSEKEAIEIANAYVQDRYENKFDNYPVSVVLDGDFWCVSWAPPASGESELLGGGGPLVRIRKSNGSIESCLLQK